MSTDTTVDITITFSPGIVTKLLSEKGDHECNGLEKLLKLYTTKSTTNMHAFDENEKLLKFDTIMELIDHYMKVRMDHYIKRKAYQLLSLNKEASALSNKARFIGEVLENTLDLRKKKTCVVSALLKEKGYDIIDDDEDYKYLVKLPMDSVTEENVTKIMSERDRKLSELNLLKTTEEKDIWLNELSILKSEYIKCKERKEDTISIIKKVVKKKVLKL